jgi:nucleotide-binding universal stress UspA family protein
MINILVLLSGTIEDKSVLKTALLAARPFAGCLDCIFVRPGALQIVMQAAVTQFGTVTNNIAVIRSAEKQAAERAARARAAFDSFVSDQGKELSDNPGGRRGVYATYREVEGDASEQAIAEARYYDLVVVGRSAKDGGYDRADLGAIILSVGRPVLIAPSVAPEVLGTTAVIAWKNVAEAARAVTSAMPLLTKADRIFVLTAPEGAAAPSLGLDSAGRMAAQLRNHGLPTEANCVVPGGQAPQDAVLKTAHELRGDLLIMGAYGHSRTREFIFGGFTRQVLENCRLPVLLFH